MKKDKNIYVIVLIGTILIAIFAASYAFFGGNDDNFIVANYEVVFKEKYHFAVSGTQGDNVTVSDFDMFGDGIEKVIVQNNHEVTISVENLVDTEATTCTFDYVWRWDMTKDGYKKSEGATYEYVVSGPFAEVNVPDYDASSFVLGSDEISLASGQKENTKTVSITSKFYNLADVDQNIHATKSYKGGIIIDNILCN